jgi:hypothetical protein
MKNTLFCDLMPCSLVGLEAIVLPPSSGLEQRTIVQIIVLVAFLFDSEYVGKVIFRNVGGQGM